MNQPEASAHVQARFSTPIATFRLRGTESMNAGLRAAALERESRRAANPIPSQAIQPEVFESDFDLFQWPEPAVKQLKDVVYQYLGRVVAETNGYSPDELARLTIRQHCWAHVTRHGGYVQPHNHPNASWSAVYCVDPGPRDEAHPDAGALQFFDPRAGGAMYRDPGNERFVPAFSNDSLKLNFVAGDLVFFPSDLMHAVTPYFGPGERITIAANFWFGRRG